MFWTIGKSYFVQTVTLYVTGCLTEMSDKELVFADASYIAETGRLADTMKNGNFAEVEPYSSSVLINRDSIVVAREWTLPLPMKQFP